MGWLKENWYFIIVLILAGALTIIEIYFQEMDLLISISLAAGVIIFSILDKVKNDSKTSNLFTVLTEKSKNVDELEKVMKDQVAYNDEYQKKKEQALEIIRQAWGLGQIEEEEVIKHFISTTLYCLYCFPTTLPSQKKKIR